MCVCVCVDILFPLPFFCYLLSPPTASPHLVEHHRSTGGKAIEQISLSLSPPFHFSLCLSPPQDAHLCAYVYLYISLVDFFFFGSNAAALFIFIFIFGVLKGEEEERFFLEGKKKKIEVGAVQHK